MAEKNLAEIKRKLNVAEHAINKGAKYARIANTSDVPNPFFLRRPCGITQLDVDTGGGLPAGGICYVSGPDSSGKTWLLYNYFAMHQKIYGEAASILYAPVEFLPDYKFMRQIGCKVSFPESMLDQIDRDRQLRRMPKLNKAERFDLTSQVGNFKVLRATTAEEMLDSLLIAYESGAYHIIAVDSISVLQASVEASLATLTDNPQQAANATLLTRFMQRFHPLTLGLTSMPVETTMIFTAQVRANRHKSEAPAYIAKYLKDWQAGGANAMKHGKLIDIQMWSEGKDKEGPTGAKRVVAKTIKWNLVKAKAGAHDNTEGEYTYRYSTPGDNTQSIIDCAMKYGVASETKGTGELTFHDKMTGEVLQNNGAPLTGIKGLAGLQALLKQDPGTEFLIRREILSAAGIGTCLYM